MRMPFVIVASLAIISSCLSTASFAQQSNAAGASNPLPQAEASPDDIEGGKMFATTCGFCHQDGGRHAGRGPKLSKSERSDEYIVERIKKGKVGAMPAYGSVVSDGQIIAILAYIRGLDDSSVFRGIETAISPSPIRGRPLAADALECAGG